MTSLLEPERTIDAAAETRPYHHGDLHRGLVAAARAILERDGPQALSLRAVAREAGVSPAAPYHHFADKAELLNAVAVEGFSELAKAMVIAREADPGDPLIAMGVAYVVFARANPPLYRVMYDCSRDKAEMHRDGEDQGPHAYELVRESLIQHDGFSPDDAISIELARGVLWCAAHGLAEMASFGHFAPPDRGQGRRGPVLQGDPVAAASPQGVSGAAAAAFVTRFAPSPTGRLHLGHAFSALTVAEAARMAGGRWLLRIEDIDATRCRPEFEAAICEDLAWLGLEWDRPVRRQSEHMADYGAALSRLQADGLLYRCFRTRREIAQAAASAPHAPEAPFRGAPLATDEEDNRLARGEPFAWRLSLDRARDRLGVAFDRLAYLDLDRGEQVAQPDVAGDVVLARKDVGVAYHLACVVDDATQGVTHVIRGDDLREAVHPQRLLQALLGLSTPAYGHHRLLLDADGRRLAKRDGAESLADLRARGVTPGEVRALIGVAEGAGPL